VQAGNGRIIFKRCSSHTGVYLAIHELEDISRGDGILEVFGLHSLKTLSSRHPNFVLGQFVQPPQRILHVRPASFFRCLSELNVSVERCVARDY
jgi:hypothetical protein